MDIMMLNQFEEITNESSNFSSMKRKMSVNYLIDDTVTKTIIELKSFQNEMTDIQNKFLILQMKNQKIVDDMNALLMNLNRRKNEVDSTYSQCDSVEVKDIGIHCNIESELLLLFDEEPVKTVNHLKDSTTPNLSEFDCIDKGSYNVESITEFDGGIQNIIKLEDQKEKKCEKPIMKKDKYVFSYSKEDMLTYLSRFKIDFLKFVQCNHNNSIPGGCSELIRSFSNASVDNQGITEEKVYDSKTSSNNLLSTRNKSQHRLKSASGLNEISDSNATYKPKLRVIECNNISQDPLIKSNLYEDLDCHKHSDKRYAETNERDISDNNIKKIGGGKRINAFHSISKRNLLKSQIQKSQLKRKKSWKSEISDLQTHHEVVYGESEQVGSVKNVKLDALKPLETIFTTRMKKRLNKILSTSRSENYPYSMVIESNDVEQSLSSVKLGFLASGKQMDKEFGIIDKTPLTKERGTNIFDKKLSKPEFYLDLNHEKSYHLKSKKVRTLSQDLSDGEII